MEQTSVREKLAAFNDLVVAGVEIISGQIFTSKPTKRFPTRDVSISRVAGELLLDAGVVNSVDQGILVFHERIGRDKPALRRTLARIDRAMGRLPKVKRTAPQRAFTQALKGGLVVRDRATGRIKGLNKQGKALLKKVRTDDRKKRLKKIQLTQRTAIKKLKGIGG